MGSFAVHNVPAVRSISFVRIIPNLFMKFARIPAMFGGAMIAGLAYMQYQATRKSLHVSTFRCMLMLCNARGW